MATVIDITSKIKNEKKSIRLGEKEYPVNDSKNAVTEVMAIMNSTDGMDTEAIDRALTVMLGKEAVAEFSDMSFEDYLVPFIAVMALAMGVSYEEAESSFRGFRGQQS